MATLSITKHSQTGLISEQIQQAGARGDLPVPATAWADRVLVAGKGKLPHGWNAWDEALPNPCCAGFGGVHITVLLKGYTSYCS